MENPVDLHKATVAAFEGSKRGTLSNPWVAGILRNGVCPIESNKMIPNN